MNAKVARVQLAELIRVPLLHRNGLITGLTGMLWLGPLTCTWCFSMRGLLKDDCNLGIVSAKYRYRYRYSESPRRMSANMALSCLGGTSYQMLLICCDPLLLPIFHALSSPYLCLRKSLWWSSQVNNWFNVDVQEYTY